MVKLDYVVVVPSELSAGLRGFTEDVSVQLEHTDKAIYDAGQQSELVEHFRTAIADWFDVKPTQVPTLEQYTKDMKRMEAAEGREMAKITKDFGKFGGVQSAEFSDAELDRAFRDSNQHLGTMTDMLHAAHPDLSRGLCQAAAETRFFTDREQ